MGTHGTALPDNRTIQTSHLGSMSLGIAGADRDRLSGREQAMPTFRPPATQHIQHRSAAAEEHLGSPIDGLNGTSFVPEVNSAVAVPPLELVEILAPQPDHTLPSKAAVRRLVTVTVSGLRPPP